MEDLGRVWRRLTHLLSWQGWSGLGVIVAVTVAVSVILQNDPVPRRPTPTPTSTPMPPTPITIPIPRLIYDSAPEGGMISRGGDIENSVFEANVGEYARVFVFCANREIDGIRFSCPDDGLSSPTLALYGPNGEAINPDSLNFGQGTEATLIVRSLPSTGGYTVAVRGSGGRTGRYNLQLSHEVAPVS